MRSVDLRDGWQVLQDVHDRGEELGIYRSDWDPYRIDAAVSPWQAIPRLAHLQLLLARQPYFGRELRYFNEHPWWYRLEFEAPEDFREGATLRFEGVDYFADVWLNQTFLGSHEGYFEPFEFEVGSLLRADHPNLLIAKVSSPWDTEVPAGLEDRRTFAVVRNLIKGTYEHADTFIQRDVNPVGIWRPVDLITHGPLRPAGRPVIRTTVSGDSPAEVSVAWPVCWDEARSEAEFVVRVFSEGGREITSRRERVALDPGDSVLSTSMTIDHPRLWSTWDRGDPYLYRAEFLARIAGAEPIFASETFGIRTMELRRTDRETTFLLNGRPIFLRGTSYFPDVYLSALDRARYERDVTNMLRTGVNAVRVHVHVENDAFYELCDQRGLLVIQDFDLNWRFPTDEVFCNRAVSALEAMVRKLRNHPSIACWICQNEPMGRADGPMHTLSPGPQLEAAAMRLDPTRPVIRSSDVDDASSGDSHNWSGALDRAVRDYRAIRGTTEKLNTEFGFDAPPAAGRIEMVPELAGRLAAVIPRIAQIHDYQYHLTKYFIEHYRRQKYSPCAGYFQFMWIDLSPQSFYGIYDWWGLPKMEGIGGGLRALEESNQPVAVLLDCEERPAALWVVNDMLDDLGLCTLTWSVQGLSGDVTTRGSSTVEVGPDSLVRAGEIVLLDLPEECHRVLLTLHDADGQVLARNGYYDPLVHPPHPEGHPQRMDHELGMRLYWA